MRITIDTDTKTVIVPNSYYGNIDKMNAIATKSGGKPFDYVQYVKDEFTAAIANPLKRQSDIAPTRTRSKKTTS
jgi:hypothetical protein